MTTNPASRRPVRAVALALTLMATAAVALGTAPKAQAWPKYAAKEHKPCSYCHVNPKGGGPRNANGLWYHNHKLSFAGYTREKAAKEAKVPISQVPVDPDAGKAPKPKETPKPSH